MKGKLFGRRMYEKGARWYVDSKSAQDNGANLEKGMIALIALRKSRGFCTFLKAITMSALIALGKTRVFWMFFEVVWRVGMIALGRKQTGGAFSGGVCGTQKRGAAAKPQAEKPRGAVWLVR
jgi:hypothetical protein